MSNKERIKELIDKLFGAWAGICLFYGIKSQNPSYKIVTGLLKELENEVLKNA